MRKYLLLVLLCASFLLAGCGKVTPVKNETKEPVVEEKKTSTLVCSLFTEHTINFTTEMAFYFENNIPTKLGIRYSYDLSGYSDEQRQTFASGKMCETDSIKNTLQMTDCQEGYVDTNYIVKGYSPKLLNQTIGTPTSIKESYEKQGWTCTLK